MRFWEPQAKFCMFLAVMFMFFSRPHVRQFWPNVASKHVANIGRTLRNRATVGELSRQWRSVGKAPKGPEQSAAKPMYTKTVIEAACCLSVGLDEQKLLKAYGERTLNAADPIRHIGLARTGCGVCPA